MNRYDRQIKFNEFGMQGQENLLSSTIMVMGAGALGTHVSEMLARMGAGKLIIIDMDIVEMTNLHRQALYTEQDAERMLPKVEAVKEKLYGINSNVDITSLNTELKPDNISTILREYQPDIVIDGMDHFEIRFLINEACYNYNIPWVYGAAVGSKGSVYAIDFNGPCLKCLMETLPSTGESCEINGVLPPAVHLVASLEVSEVIRFLSHQGFSKKLITIDTFDMNYQTMNVDALKNNSCKVCEAGVYEQMNRESAPSVQSNCGNVYTFRFNKAIFNHDITGEVIKKNSFVKLIVYKKYHMTLFRDGRMNVHGLNEKEEADDLFQEIKNQLSVYNA